MDDYSAYFLRAKADLERVYKLALDRQYNDAHSQILIVVEALAGLLLALDAIRLRASQGHPGLEERLHGGSQ